MKQFISKVLSIEDGGSDYIEAHFEDVRLALFELGVLDLYILEDLKRGAILVRKRNMKASRSKLHNLMLNHQTGEVIYTGTDNGIRTSVSRFNKMHGTKFRVRVATPPSEGLEVYLPFENRTAYTLEELDAWYQPQADKLTKAQNDLVNKYNELYERVTDIMESEYKGPIEQEVYQRIPPVLDEEDEDELM